jgi:hypothetical protein
MFKNCKRIVTIDKMELGNFGGEGERMQFDSLSSKNALRHKRLERLNSSKNHVEMI